MLGFDKFVLLKSGNASISSSVFETLLSGPKAILKSEILSKLFSFILF